MKCKFWWKLSLFTNIKYILEKKLTFFNLKLLKILFNQNWWNVDFAENSINYLILSRLLKINEHFLILKILKILFNQNWWKCTFCWKLYQLSNIKWILKKKLIFFHFKDFKNIIQLKIMEMLILLKTQSINKYKGHI